MLIYFPLSFSVPSLLSVVTDRRGVFKMAVQGFTTAAKCFGKVVSYGWGALYTAYYMLFLLPQNPVYHSGVSSGLAVRGAGAAGWSSLTPPTSSHQRARASSHGGDRAPG